MSSSKLLLVAKDNATKRCWCLPISKLKYIAEMKNPALH